MKTFWWLLLGSAGALVAGAYLSSGYTEEFVEIYDTWSIYKKLHYGQITGYYSIGVSLPWVRPEYTFNSPTFQTVQEVKNWIVENGWLTGNCVDVNGIPGPCWTGLKI